MESGRKVSLPLPVASGIHHQTVFFLVDERKSSSERQKSEKSQPARVVRVEQELHTHTHTDTLTHTHGKWRLGRGKAKHTKPKAKAKENPHLLRGKAIGKACAVRESAVRYNDDDDVDSDAGSAVATDAPCGKWRQLCAALLLLLLLLSSGRVSWHGMAQTIKNMVKFKF